MALLCSPFPWHLFLRLIWNNSQGINRAVLLSVRKGTRYQIYWAALKCDGYTNLGTVLDWAIQNPSNQCDFVRCLEGTNIHMCAIKPPFKTVYSYCSWAINATLVSGIHLVGGHGELKIKTWFDILIMFPPHRQNTRGNFNFHNIPELWLACNFKMDTREM